MTSSALVNDCVMVCVCGSGESVLTRSREAAVGRNHYTAPLKNRTARHLKNFRLLDS